MQSNHGMTYWLQRRPRKSRIAKRRLASTAIEAAVITPVLLLLVAAAIDFSRIYHAEIIVTQAAERGALYGASENFVDDTKAAWETSIRDIVTQELEQLKVPAEDAPEITITATAENDLFFLVTVDIEYKFKPLIVSKFIPVETDIHRRQTIRRYR